MKDMKKTNADIKTIDGFGDEWHRFDQSDMSSSEHEKLFKKYFNIFPWYSLPANPQGYDMGCGSGRWAKLVAPRVGLLHCIDPSSAIDVARANLRNYKNCIFHQESVSDCTLKVASMDFGYSLGVLHHVPDTKKAIFDCVKLLKPGAPFLIYLYYDLDNRAWAYRFLWRLSNFLRVIVSRLPHGLRYIVSQLFAIFVYLPLARFAALLERFGLAPEKASKFPLGFYRHLSFYTMRTDALDRFGTRLEHRFTRSEIEQMMEDSGLNNIYFSDREPYWCAVGFKVQ
jgi:SAM-dependent methyltransferase